jgi:hypothetical protein
MAALARADLERLLVDRQLGVTLSSAGSPEAASSPDDRSVAATGLAGLDAELQGGWPRGHVSEIAGPLSTGATWLACASLAAATRRGELAALIDPLDRFDPESAAGEGFAWASLLWVRGEAAGTMAEGARRSADRAAMWEHVLQRALKAATLILQAEGFGVVVLDLQEIPAATIAGLPFTTWRRLQRLVEGRDAACLLVAREPLGRSAGGVTLTIGSRPDGTGLGGWTGTSPRSRRLTGLTAHARVLRAQWQWASASGFEWNT